MSQAIKAALELLEEHFQRKQNSNALSHLKALRAEANGDSDDPPPQPPGGPGGGQ